ncbi:MAG: hypothetical protein ACRDTS_06985, partial [Mycobacterium sp.]
GQGGTNAPNKHHLDAATVAASIASWGIVTAGHVVVNLSKLDGGVIHGQHGPGQADQIPSPEEAAH